MAKKNIKAAKKVLAFKVFIFAAVLILYGVSAVFYRTQIDAALNLAKYGTADISEIRGESTSKTDFQAGKLKVHYVDVGQGDATVIELPCDKTMIIDGGSSLSKINRGKLTAYMNNNLEHIDGFDYVILTHSDEDHSGGLYEILKNFPVRENGRIYRPNQKSSYSGYADPALSKAGIETFWGNYGQNAAVQNSAAYKNFLDAAYGQEADNVTVIVTDANKPDDMNILHDLNGNGKYDGGKSEEYLISFYAPAQAAWNKNNNYSPIISLEYQDRTFMFSGDAESVAEKAFVNENGAAFGNADVIKLGHHGSNTSTSVEYLKAILPSATDNPNVIAVISSNPAGNSHGHPHKQVLDRLEAFGFKAENVLRTDTVGTIVLAVSNGILMYGTIEISQSEGFEPLSWVTIGAAIVIVIFVLLFVVKFHKKR